PGGQTWGPCYSPRAAQRCLLPANIRTNVSVMHAEVDRVGIFIGGVQKAGTTSLHSYFMEHPALLAPRKKETHFFDNETVDWSNRDYRTDLHNKFYPKARLGAIAYDATPITIFWPPAVERILAYNPDAKFIFLFRDPIERAFSHWRMEIERNAESLPFSAAIREGRERLNGLPELHWDYRVYTYVERGFYGHQVERLLRQVPRDQLLFLSSTELATKPSAVLATIADFLSIEPFPETSPRRVFVGSASTELAEGDVEYLSTIFSEDTQRFAALTDLDVSDWLVCKPRTAALGR
ncbi:MAG TPA: sulfotransferase, partial [Sphingomicrobium sp.]|nr:sulfotransferase [Sphingomicrobium sp.]